jgi:hypothetical protein
MQNNPNLKNAVLFDLLALSSDEQREFLGLVENFLNLKNQSFNFPYPVYFLSLQDQSISALNLIQSMNDLPKFYRPRDIKLSIKESQLLLKTKLLQQEIKNTEENQPERSIKSFAKKHRNIHLLEEERLSYLMILNKLKKKKNHGSF